jgi:hypothetical protein
MEKVISIFNGLFQLHIEIKEKSINPYYSIATLFVPGEDKNIFECKIHIEKSKERYVFNFDEVIDNSRHIITYEDVFNVVLKLGIKYILSLNQFKCIDPNITKCTLYVDFLGDDKITFSLIGKYYRDHSRSTLDELKKRYPDYCREIEKHDYISESDSVYHFIKAEYHQNKLNLYKHRYHLNPSFDNIMIIEGNLAVFLASL